MGHEHDIYDDIPDLINDDNINTDYTINDIIPIYDINPIWNLNNINIYYYINNYVFNRYFPDIVTDEQYERISNYLSAFR